MRYTAKLRAKCRQLIKRDRNEFEFIGEGSFRTVYRHRDAPGVVFKFPRRDYEDVLANQTEWANWVKYSRQPEKRRRLAPCKDFYRKVLIQTEVQPANLSWAMEKNLTKLFQKSSVCCDLYDRNVGIYQNRIVICDYQDLGQE